MAFTPLKYASVYVTLQHCIEYKPKSECISKQEALAYYSEPKFMLIQYEEL